MLLLGLGSDCCCCCWVLLLTLTAVRAHSDPQHGHHSNHNSIKNALLSEPPTAQSSRTGTRTHTAPKKGNVVPLQVNQCSSDKECTVGSYCHGSQFAPSRCLTCRRRKKRCHRDAMCCPGNRCSNYICVPFPENLLTHHVPSLKEHKKLNKDKSWRKSQPKLPVKGHEGDPCLRSSDCSDGFCCARHFWTKICKPVLHQGEVCTKQRKKGTHNLEIFQRCDCAKGLTCKVWKDATSYSKSRLHMCQRN